MQDAARSIREASQINLLRNTWFLGLIMEACGSAKYEEALRQVHAMVPIWRKDVAAKTAATERAAELERLSAATIAGLAGWDAKYAAAKPVGLLSTPSSHMVSRALLQTVLKKLNELEPGIRLGGHGMGRAPELLGAAMVSNSSSSSFCFLF
jgi:hypothetical protein